MGRVFVIELEGPVYTCTKCHTHLGLPNDIIAKNGRHEYNFTRLFNTFLVESTSNSAFPDICCVGCSKNMGIYSVSDPNSYWVMRGELHGPEGSDDEV
ncbi:protein yippee-like At3g55890 [Raphanus sativus]|uniref:Protein yippee-like At3g55890 n=1 Tax=Raphanus sativus TaxID=3726 RepID=A0A6J0JUC2_RAPSA|nr:protein yippee-like At3g55890 [Raphanus sativus]XP_056854237.1 protein yippee-like At3g55890 [Raphanus sativus]